MEYLHKTCKIIHTDLKPENVLIAGVHGKFGKTVVNNLPALRAMYRVSKEQKKAKAPDAMFSEQKEETVSAAGESNGTEYDLVDMRLSKFIKEYEAIVVANPVDKSGNLKSGSTITAEERKKLKKKIKRLKAKRARRRLKQLQEEGLVQQQPQAASMEKGKAPKNTGGENQEENGWHIVRKRSSRKLKDVRQSKTFTEVLLAFNFRENSDAKAEGSQKTPTVEVTPIRHKNEVQKYLSTQKPIMEVSRVIQLYPAAPNNLR